ncbi:MAG: hypothetical protein A2X30_04720 [Elusimicrobia bacterium GWB2_63_16]|nr:MAG: hypothetical protein A2X30_04720 [Elusimicrobia bacterium GWB2_63_16]
MKLLRLLGIAALLPAAACYRNVNETVTTVDCGELRLQFEINEFRGPPDMPLSHFPKLYLLRSGLPRVEVDKLYARNRIEIPDLLEPEADFHFFPPLNGKDRAVPARHHLRDIFVDPQVFSAGDYDRIKACLDKNLPAIDAAFDRPMFGGDYVPAHRLRSIVYRRYEDDYSFCGDEVLGKRFDCYGGQAYIKTTLPNGLQLCRPGSVVTNSLDLIGRISRDQRSAQLRAPGSGGPANHPDYGLKALAGPDWKGFYGTCRDASGKNIFDYFAQEPWKEQPSGL